jgi:hypothetical protein
MDLSEIFRLDTPKTLGLIIIFPMKSPYVEVCTTCGQTEIVLEMSKFVLESMGTWIRLIRWLHHVWGAVSCSLFNVNEIHTSVDLLGNGLAGCRALWWLVLWRTQTCDSKGLNLEDWPISHSYSYWLNPQFCLVNASFHRFPSLFLLVKWVPFCARQLSVDAATGWWLHHVPRSHCLSGVVWLTAPSTDHVGIGNWALRGPAWWCAKLESLESPNPRSAGGLGVCQFQGRETGRLLNSFGEKLLVAWQLIHWHGNGTWGTKAMYRHHEMDNVAAYTQHLTKGDIMRTVTLVFSTVVQSSWGDSFNLATSLI